MKPSVNMGQGTTFFFGKVEDRNDPLKIGRVKVRIFAYHNDDKQKLPTDLLPWAATMQGVVSAAAAGIGMSPTGMMVGTTVIGIFLDGSYCQQPFILGPYAGKPEGVSDVSKLATGDSKAAKGNTSFEPSNPAKAKYPFNKVFSSESGHIIEVDDTPGAERLQIYHKTGSYSEFHPDGTLVHKAAKDSFDITVGKKTIYIGGDADVHVDGNVSAVIKGRLDAAVTGAIGVTSDASIKASAPQIEIQEVSQSESAATSGNHILMAKQSYVGAFDDIIAKAPDSVKEMYPTTKKDPDQPIATANVVSGPANGKPVLGLDIGNVGTIVVTGDNLYEMNVSNNFTIAHFSTSSMFPHELSEQLGQSVNDIVNNMKGLSENLLEPIVSRYPGLTITSGFRPSTEDSQHATGQAVDIQWAGISNAKYLEIANWVGSNLPVDQLILEHGNDLWLHVSYNQQSRSQRRDILTMVNETYVTGLQLFR